VTPPLQAKRNVSAHQLFRTLASLLASDASGSKRHAIAVLDVDRLTEINRAYGRGAGDAVLARVSDAIALCLEADEQTAWWARDQCVLLFPGAGRRKALRRTRRIVGRIAGRAGASDPCVSVSAGVAAYPVDGQTNSALVEASAAALRRAKRDGRGRVRASRWC
jgi:diguanylate cyclase (GGDEF)-like protein